MAKDINPLFESLAGNPILLPLAFVFNTITYLTDSNKVVQEKWAALELMKRIVGLTSSFVIWTTHLLIKHVASQVLPTKIVRENGIDDVSRALDNAIGRALCQVLALINDIPASSQKYEFARSLAENIIVQNLSQGNHILGDTNVVALQGAFGRTVEMLVVALEQLQQQQELKGISWSSALVNSFFSKNLGTLPLTFSFESICTWMRNFLFPVAKATSELPPLQYAASSREGLNLNALAEKLAQELLWITEKLKECSSIDEVTGMWSAMSRLAKLSLSAHPRIQSCLMRVSALLLKHLAAHERDKWTNRLKVDVLLQWLPLFCHAKNGFDCPSLSPSEKAGILRAFEQIIFSLPAYDQEKVLACWLREYVTSSAEWPNLQECFESWCHSMRKAAVVDG